MKLIIDRGISTWRDTLFYRTPIKHALDLMKGRIVLTLYLHIAQEQLHALPLDSNREESWAQIIRTCLPCALRLTPTARRDSASGMTRANTLGSQLQILRRIGSFFRNRPLPLTYIDCKHYHNNVNKSPLSQTPCLLITLSSLTSIPSLTKEPKPFKRSIDDYCL